MTALEVSCADMNVCCLLDEDEEVRNKGEDWRLGYMTCMFGYVREKLMENKNKKEIERRRRKK